MRATVLAAAAASFLALSAVPGAGAAQAEKPVVITDRPVVIADQVTARARVIDVDRAARTVTLQQSNGNKTEVKVDDAVRNFDDIERGDPVVVRYYQSVGLDLQKVEGAREPPSLRTGRGVARLAPKGGMSPTAVSGASMLTAQVDAVDYANRLVTLRGPKGDAVTVRAGDRVKDLEQIRKGDQVEAIYTQALAVSMEKPKA